MQRHPRLSEARRIQRRDHRRDKKQMRTLGVIELSKRTGLPVGELLHLL